MNIRDKQIIASLNEFRVLSREQIERLHFSHLKSPAKAANSVLLRLRRDGHISVSKERRMHLYFPTPSIKKDSAKINHYLALCDFYLDCKKYDMPKRFTIEPKFAKGGPEPDIFMIWQGAPFYVELQRSVYSDKVMKAKLDRYEAFYDSDMWKSFDWQPAGKSVFPRVWIVSEHRYTIERPFHIIQTRSVDEFIQRFIKR